MSGERQESREPVEVTRVGKLRAALEGLPDDRLILCQVVGADGSAWNVGGSFVPQVRYGTVALLQMSHPELTTLPPIPARAPEPEPAEPSPERVKCAVEKRDGWCELCQGSRAEPSPREPEPGEPNGKSFSRTHWSFQRECPDCGGLIDGNTPCSGAARRTEPDALRERMEAILPVVREALAEGLWCKPCAFVALGMHGDDGGPARHCHRHPSSPDPCDFRGLIEELDELIAATPQEESHADAD